MGDAARAKEIAKRIIDDAKELGVKEIIISECGHAYYVMRWLAPNWFGPDFHFTVTSLVEVIAGYISRASSSSTRLPTRADHRPCLGAPGRKGGVLEEPRAVIRPAVQNFLELTPNRDEALPPAAVIGPGSPARAYEPAPTASPKPTRSAPRLPGRSPPPARTAACSSAT